MEIDDGWTDDHDDGSLRDTTRLFGSRSQGQYDVSFFLQHRVVNAQLSFAQDWVLGGHQEVRTPDWRHKPHPAAGPSIVPRCYCLGGIGRGGNTGLGFPAPWHRGMDSRANF